jgi:hypothetical protein
MLILLESKLRTEKKFAILLSISHGASFIRAIRRFIEKKEMGTKSNSFSFSL